MYRGPSGTTNEPGNSLFPHLREGEGWWNPVVRSRPAVVRSPGIEGSDETPIVAGSHTPNKILKRDLWTVDKLKHSIVCGGSIHFRSTWVDGRFLIRINGFVR